MDWSISDEAMNLYANNFADRGGAVDVKTAGECTRRFCEPVGEERLRVGSEESRSNPRRVGKALRDQSGTQIVISAGFAAGHNRRVRTQFNPAFLKRLWLLMSLRFDSKGINKTFGSFVALKSIDLTIEAGELVCFLGPSGCGKTTLLRIIAGLEQQTQRPHSAKRASMYRTRRRRRAITASCFSRTRYFRI